MDQDKLADLRRRYADAKGGALYDPEFKRVSQTQFQGERRKWPFTEPATLLAAPHRPNAARRELRRPRRRARRRADGSRRHEPGRRPARPAGGAGRRAHRPLRARAEMRALERGADRRHRRRADAQPLLARKLPCRHREPFRRHPRRRRAHARGRRRPLDQPRDPQGAGPRPAARHDPCRRPLRHVGRVRGREVPPRRAVPAGRARGRARPGAHDPDRHPRRRRVSVGVLLRFGDDGDPRRGDRRVSASRR